MMNEIKQTLQQDVDALLKRLQQSRRNGTGVSLSVSDVGVLCEALISDGWIDVNDRLPINNPKELNGSLHKGVEVLVFDGTQVRNSYFSSGNTVDFWTCFEAKNVTHWIPLPKEPSRD